MGMLLYGMVSEREGEYRRVVVVMGGLVYGKSGVLEKDVVGG